MGKDTDIVRLGKLKSYCWHNSGESVLSKPWVILRKKSVIIPMKLPLFFSNLRRNYSVTAQVLSFDKIAAFLLQKTYFITGIAITTVIV